MNKYKLIFNIVIFFWAIYAIFFDQGVDGVVYAIGSAYLICGSGETCCDTAGPGGTCCDQCITCSGNACSGNKANNSPCYTAEPNSVCCDGTCSGLNDSSNCGSCGNVCDFDQVCYLGACVPA